MATPRWITAAEVEGGVIPPGGAINQVLAKESNTDYDLKWADGGGGGGSFLSANTARVDPSGNDGTGTVGDLNKPFLTVQAAIDAFVDATATFGVIEIGANAFQEDLTIDDAINIEFVGVSRHFTPPSGDAISQAFSSLTLTAAALIGLTNCKVGDIFTSQDLTLHLKNAQTNDITSTQTGGDLSVICLASDSETTGIHGGNVGTLTVTGCRPGDTGTDPIDLDSMNGGTITIRNCNQQSGYTGCYDVEAANGSVDATNSLLNDVTADTINFTDSRAVGTITVGAPPVGYNDVFLRGVPPGGTTGQALEKASNDDFDTSWESLV